MAAKSLMVCKAAVLVLMGLTLTGAAGEPNLGGIIESEGTATVDAAPDTVEFWLQKTAAGASMYEATAAALAFPSKVSEALEAAALEPDETLASEVSIPDASQAIVRVAATLRFSMSTMSTAEDGIEQFATLCDTLRNIANSTESALEGPLFQVNARNELQDSAIARAVEQALPPAEAAARVMKTRVQTVQQVEVLNVAWNKELDSKAPQPQVRRVTCTARVRVRYGFAVE